MSSLTKAVLHFGCRTSDLGPRAVSFKLLEADAWQACSCTVRPEAGICICTLAPPQLLSMDCTHMGPLHEVTWQPNVPACAVNALSKGPVCSCWRMPRTRAASTGSSRPCAPPSPPPP